MIEQELQYNNEVGLHARPASVLVQKAENFSSTKIEFIKDNKTANVKSILGVLWLQVKDGDKLLLRVEGKSEVAAAEEIKDLIEYKLQEISYRDTESEIRSEIDEVEPKKMMQMLGAGLRENLARLSN